MNMQPADMPLQLNKRIMNRKQNADFDPVKMNTSDGSAEANQTGQSQSHVSRGRLGNVGGIGSIPPPQKESLDLSLQQTLESCC